MAKWFIEDVEISGNFFKGLSLKFSPNLVCIIGPRGSGKTTLAEAIRLGLCGSNGVAKSRLELIRENLANAMITVRTINNTDQARYTIRRILGQPPILLAGDGRIIDTVDLDRGTFLPIDAYSSGEIEEIARADFGARRRELLDDLRPAEFHETRQKVAGFKRLLEANADAIRTADRQIGDLTERIEELGDARERLASLGLPSADDPSAAVLVATRTSQSNDREADEVRQLQERLTSLHGDLNVFAEQIRRDVRWAGEPSESTNDALLERIRVELASLSRTLNGKLQESAQAVTETEARLVDIANQLATAHKSFATEFMAIQEMSKSATAAAQERAKAENAVATLENLERDRTKARAQRERLLVDRRELRANFLLERDRISTLREAEAVRLGAEIGTKIRIRVLRNADSQSYQDTLLQGLRGARVRNHEDILNSLMRLRPEQLAQIVQDNDADEFELQTSLGPDRGRKILDAFRQSLDPLALEIETIDDRVCVELNVASGENPNFKDAADVSRGQQCTALLPLLLARRDTPLIIDQPEDNLDNHFVYETVVESIRRLKRWRQMIFITHNANIPVLGEAELVVVLNSDGRRGFLEKVGTLDECRDEIIDLLEGGREAFELRRRRYYDAQ